MAITTKPLVTGELVDAIRLLIERNPSMGRSELSREACRLLGWRSPSGMPKDIAARSMLRSLDKAGMIALPPPMKAPRSFAKRKPEHMDHDMRPIACRLADLAPVSMEPARSKEALAELKSILSQFHCLGFDRMIGANMGYAARSKDGALLAVALFGSAAWSCADRDAYIGWGKEHRCGYSLNGIMKMLVYSRTLAPASKKRTYKERGRYFDKMDFSLGDVYRSLSAIANYAEDLQLWLHGRVRRRSERDTSIVFYDVTNYCFEIDKQDDMRRKGVSKEHRPDPIVQMGLLMDNDGLPISYQLFPGNCNDCLTLVPLMKDIRRGYDIGKAVVVADKGMNTGRNAYCLANSRGGYLFSQTVRGGTAELKSYVLKASGYIERPGDAGFKMKSRQYERLVEFEEEDGAKPRRRSPRSSSCSTARTTTGARRSSGRMPSPRRRLSSTTPKNTTSTTLAAPRST